MRRKNLELDSRLRGNDKESAGDDTEGGGITGGAGMDKGLEKV